MKTYRHYWAPALQAVFVGLFWISVALIVGAVLGAISTGIW